MEEFEILEDGIERLYNFLMEKPLQVLNIFNDFFGEERVDMQGYPTLEEFKSWLNIETISTYMTRLNSGMSGADWSRFNTFTIVDLPFDKAVILIERFYHDTSLLDSLISAKFKELFIIVHFPQVRVTNEYDRYVDINHLWAKVKVACDGTLIGSFGLNRSEYTLLHMQSDYMHSHISGINTLNFSEFRSPCLGSGPIRSTIYSLNRSFDENFWNLFCLELSKYVTVESVQGGPYRHLERIGSGDGNSEVSHYTYILPSYYSQIFGADKLRDFIKYFVNSKELKFNYKNNSYSIGVSFIEYIILISNSFINWYNDQYNKKKINRSYDDLVRSGVIWKGIIDKGKIYRESEANRLNNYSNYIGKKVCTFKGKDITINITDFNEVIKDNYSTFLNPQIASFILTNILKVLNYRYGRSKAIHEDDKFGTDVRYL